MTEAITQKMYEIAKDLDELNARGKVKKFSKEKGYAKVYQIKKGCSIWVHLLKDGRLIIDLLVMEAASNAYPDDVNRSIQRFQSFFNNATKYEEFKTAIDERNAERYFVEISDEKLDNILELLRKIKLSFHDLI